MIETTSQLQIENDRLKRQRKIMLVGIGVLSLSTIIGFILWILGLNLKPTYEGPIDPAKFNLRDSVTKFRTVMAPSTKTQLIMYHESSISSYHALKFQSIVSSSGIPLTNANYSWQMVFYPMIRDGKMSLAIMPGIVEKDIAGNILKVFDYFDPTTFATIYNSKALTAYDFGHLEP
jgi:hypothetical protein